jgi:hypothetical protein
MNDVITKMRGELRHVLKDSVAAYPGAPRDKWLFDWPSQVILVVNQIFWCQEVEQVGGRGCALCLVGRSRASTSVRQGTPSMPAASGLDATRRPLQSLTPIPRTRVRPRPGGA